MPWPSHEPRADRAPGGARANCLPIGSVTVLVAVVGVGDVDVVAGEHVVADLDRVVADDPAPLADEHAVADGDDR